MIDIFLSLGILSLPVFITFILFIYLFILATLHGMQDLSSSTRDWIHTPAGRAQSPNLWATREVPSCLLQTPHSWAAPPHRNTTEARSPLAGWPSPWCFSEQPTARRVACSTLAGRVGLSGLSWELFLGCCGATRAAVMKDHRRTRWLKQRKRIISQLRRLAIKMSTDMYTLLCIRWITNEKKHSMLSGDLHAKEILKPSNPTPGHTHRGNQIWKRHVHPSVHRSTVYNSPDMEAT